MDQHSHEAWPAVRLDFANGAKTTDSSGSSVSPKADGITHLVVGST
jgi:hypothetical protein